MSAYVIVDIDIIDQATYDEYKQLSPATVAAYGGKYLTRGGRTEIMEGEWLPKRLVILQFESVARARQWLDSPEYTAIKHLRHKATKTNMIVTEGV